MRRAVAPAPTTARGRRRGQPRALRPRDLRRLDARSPRWAYARRMLEVTALRGRHAIPPRTLTVTDPAHVDYADAFTLHHDGTVQESPERWARAMFGDEPSAGIRLIFSTLLRMHLRHDDPQRSVAGIRIIDAGSETAELASSGPLLRCTLLITTTTATTTLTTLIHEATRRGMAVWTPLSAAHRRLGPKLLRDAHGELT